MQLQLQLLWALEPPPSRGVNLRLEAVVSVKAPPLFPPLAAEKETVSWEMSSSASGFVSMPYAAYAVYALACWCPGTVRGLFSIRGGAGLYWDWHVPCGGLHWAKQTGYGIFNTIFIKVCFWHLCDMDAYKQYPGMAWPSLVDRAFVVPDEIKSTQEVRACQAV